MEIHIYFAYLFRFVVAEFQFLYSCIILRYIIIVVIIITTFCLLNTTRLEQKNKKIVLNFHNQKEYNPSMQ